MPVPEVKEPLTDKFPDIEKLCATEQLYVPEEFTVKFPNALVPVVLFMFNVLETVVVPVTATCILPQVFVFDEIFTSPLILNTPVEVPLIVPPFIVKLVRAIVAATEQAQLLPLAIVTLPNVFVPVVLFIFNVPFIVVEPETLIVTAPIVDVPEISNVTIFIVAVILPVIEPPFSVAVPLIAIVVAEELLMLPPVLMLMLFMVFVPVVELSVMVLAKVAVPLTVKFLVLRSNVPLVMVKLLLIIVLAPRVTVLVEAVTCRL